MSRLERYLKALEEMPIRDGHCRGCRHFSNVRHDDTKFIFVGHCASLDSFRWRSRIDEFTDACAWRSPW